MMHITIREIYEMCDAPRCEVLVSHNISTLNLCLALSAHQRLVHAGLHLCAASQESPHPSCRFSTHVGDCLLCIVLKRRELKLWSAGSHPSDFREVSMVPTAVVIVGEELSVTIENQCSALHE